MKRIVVVGAGIAGLSLARALRARADGRIDLTILERSERAGGNIRSERIEGHLCEWGPHGFLDNAPATRALVDSLGLAPRKTPSSSAASQRFVMAAGRLRELPRGPGGLLFGSLLSPAGRLRLLAEPFLGGRPADDTSEETIAAFARRRIGRQAAERIVGPAVAGIYAGDPDALSLRACFPDIWAMERENGSVVRGMIARRKKKEKKKPGTGPARLTSFVDGMEELIRALSAELAGALHLGVPLTGVRPAAAGPHRFELIVEGAASVAADTVVLSCHAHHAAKLLEGMSAPAARTLRAVATAPVAVVCMGWKEEAVSGAMKGFGFLIAREERRRTLGILFETNVFPGRAPDGCVAARAILGGALDPQAILADDASLLASALADLRDAFGVTAAPSFVRVFRHPLGIPQYTLGHLDRLAGVEQELAAHPGLHLTGSSYRGVSINACIAEAEPLAERILASL